MVILNLGLFFVPVFFKKFNWLYKEEKKMRKDAINFSEMLVAGKMVFHF